MDLVFSKEGPAPYTARMCPHSSKHWHFKQTLSQTLLAGKVAWKQLFCFLQCAVTFTDTSSSEHGMETNDEAIHDYRTTAYLALHVSLQQLAFGKFMDTVKSGVKTVFLHSYIMLHPR